jgi:alkanesulfonate monooxygenase SsuD/methylene tetrahydromethanopterin reductase-like flavin-dependent oxidoreductase (luciferase family)
VADFGLSGSLGTWASPDPVAAFREIVEQLPPVFTTLWMSDHLQQDGEPWPEGWTRLAYLAAAIPRFRYGNLVLSQSYRNPGLLAAMAATLQKASRGRLILGLGAGWLEEEYRAFNFDYPSGGVRVAQLAEAIEIIRAMWTGEPATYHGEWYRVDGAVCARPDPPIPILVGTNGPKALKVAARLADWWNWDGPWETSYRQPYERLAAACAEIGRSLEELTLAANLAISMPDDPSAFETSYTHDFYPGQVFANVGPTADEVIREIELLVDHGVSHVQLDFANRAELGRFVAEVVPHVRLEPRSAAPE